MLYIFIYITYIYTYIYIYVIYLQFTFYICASGLANFHLTIRCGSLRNKNPLRE
jgi:hypothetical protein